MVEVTPCPDGILTPPLPQSGRAALSKPLSLSVPQSSGRIIRPAPLARCCPTCLAGWLEGARELVDRTLEVSAVKLEGAIPRCAAPAAPCPWLEGSLLMADGIWAACVFDASMGIPGCPGFLCPEAVSAYSCPFGRVHLATSMSS